MKDRDLEEEIWKVYGAIDTDSLERIDRRLKALDLVVKIRGAAQKIKPGPKGHDARAQTQAVVDKLNEK